MSYCKTFTRVLLSCMQCKKCLQKKSLSEFHNDKLRKNGKYPYCKECRRAISGSNPRSVAEIIGKFREHEILLQKRYPVIRISGKYVRAHVFIMEKIIGRKLKKGEVVHHIDFDKFNWHEDNLQLMTDHEHRVLHGDLKKNIVEAICTNCGSVKRMTQSNLNRIKNIGIYQCQKCYRGNGGATGRRKFKESL